MASQKVDSRSVRTHTSAAIGHFFVYTRPCTRLLTPAQGGASSDLYPHDEERREGEPEHSRLRRALERDELLLELLFAGPDQIIRLLPAGEELERRHRFHTILRSHVLRHVDVALVELNVRELRVLRELVEDRADPLARSAPRGREVDRELPLLQRLPHVRLVLDLPRHDLLCASELNET